MLLSIFCLSMGQVINFGEHSNKTIPPLQEFDLIKILPHLRALKGENIVIYINAQILKDSNILSSLLREVVTLKCMEANVIIIPDFNEQICSVCSEIFNTNNPFKTNNYLNVGDKIDLFDVIFKREIFDNITNTLRSFNAMSIGLSGHTLDIMFPDDYVDNGITVFNHQGRDMYGGLNEKREKKYSTDMLEEILKTDIIPIVSPTCKDRVGNLYIFESSLFGAYLAGFLSSLKYTEVYTNEATMPVNCIYGVERFAKILKSGAFSNNCVRMMNSGINAIQKGVQGVHIININNVHILEEFCSKSFAGLFLYDDSLL